MPDDERKGRRLGDETKGRIADLASGWTVAKPPREHARAELEDRMFEMLDDVEEGDDFADEIPEIDDGSDDAFDAELPAEDDEVEDDEVEDDEVEDDEAAPPRRESRGSIDTGVSRSGAVAANIASGTIGGDDTPPPVFDRAKIAAGQTGARVAASPVSAAAAKASAVSANVPLPSAPPKPPEPFWPTPSPRGASPTGPVPTKSSATPPAQPAVPAPASRVQSAPVAARPQPAPEPPPARPQPRTTPPPLARSQPRTTPPPLARPQPRTTPPPPPPARADSEVELDDFVSGIDARADSGSDIDSALDALDGSGVVPDGELAGPPPAVRDAARALVHIPEPPPPPPADDLRGDPTFADATRGDPTLAAATDDATAVSAPPPARAVAAGRATGGTLRSSAALPRKRGLAGDMRYVATVFFGVRRANRELAALDAKQATRQQSRRHHLTTLGRTAVALQWRLPTGGQADGEHPALAPARAQLAAIEAERLRNAEQVTAADDELAKVRADRDAAAKRAVAELAALDSELAAIAKKLEPLEKEVAQVRKRAADLRDALRHIDGKLAATEANLAAARAGKSKLDPAAVQAELATLRADRKAIQADEPVIASELDALTPRIAALEAARTDAQARRAEVERGERDDRRRVDDLLAAIGAKRKVVERAVGDAEVRRDKILLSLGEQLYVDRPDDLAGQLAPIEDLDVEIGVADRRVMELRELTSSVDRWKVARGAALLIAIVGGTAALAIWLLLLFDVM